jgi:hypothetical protein
VIFLSNPPVLVIKFGAGAASRYGSGSSKMMLLLRLRLLNTDRIRAIFLMINFDLNWYRYKIEWEK